MKKRSRLTKRGNRSSVPPTFDPKSEERLPARNNQTVQKRQSTSETSLLLYKQLNRVFDVLKYEFDTHTEGPDLLRKLEDGKNISGSITLKDSKMASPEEIDARINELNARRDEVLREIEEKTRDKERIVQTLEGDVPEDERAGMQQNVEELTTTIENYKQELASISQEMMTLVAAKEQPPPPPPAEEPSPAPPPPPAPERESIIRIKSNVQAEINRLEEELKKDNADKEKVAAEIPALNELLETTSEKKLRDWERQYQQRIAAMPALVDQPAGVPPPAAGGGSSQRVSGGAGTGAPPGGGSSPQVGGGSSPPAGGGSSPQVGGGAAPGASPPGPPPTPDGGGRKPAPAPSDFPLYDSAVLIELREADERANKASKAIEAVREQLAAYAKKDEMTPEDIKMMEEKQKELMEKMAEFEDITKRVQHLVGLVDVASSQLGPPQRPMVPVVEGVRTAGPGQATRPEDTLPKVIVCGTGDVDQVPKIIVCEPRKARDGKAPLYHQLEGKAKSTPGSGEGSRDAAGSKRCPPTCGGASGGGMPPGGPGGGYPGYPPGQMSMGPGMGGMYGPPMGGMGGPPMGGMGGPPMGGMGGPPMGGMGRPPMGGMAGPPMCGMGGPPMSGGCMPGMMPPGAPPGMVMGPYGPGMMGMGGMPPMGPCPCRLKKKRSGKQKDEQTEVCSNDLERKLEATLNMSEMLADQNSKLEGSRYELQEAVLDKDKQHDALMAELEHLRKELQTFKNENKELKTQACQKGGGAESEKAQCEKFCMEGLPQGGKKPGGGGLCKKELRTMPICKAQAYKEMGLPLPRNEIRPQCPGAKFAASMGWNENQGCRNELQKSVNCPDMQGPSSNPCPGQSGCMCATKGPQACPVHKGCPKPIMGSGDRAHDPLCPCGCMAPAGQCKRADMEAIVQTMEQEVKSLQNELELVQAERRGLALQKKLLNCMAEASGGPGPSGGGGGGGGHPGARALDSGPPPNKPLVLLKKAMPDNLSTVELQLNSLREQYRKLQEDFNAKVEEVSMVRVEYEAAKRDALSLQDKCREAEARVDDLLERLRVIEMEKTKMAGSKDQMVELEQQLTMAKQRYREGQEELEEIKTTMQDQMLQLEEYRNKYLSAQQTVEEQRRQIDIMELENNRISEQVNLEIQRVKNQFQEKLTELTPLPDMLKATQMKLQECDQLRQLAERNVEQLLNQSDELKDQNKKLESELEELRRHTATQAGEKESLTRGLTTGEKKIEEIKSENNKLRATVKRLEEVALNNDRRLDEKNHEVLQLQTQLETLREESARQVSRTKDRCEAVRRTLQGQISQLECQLAQSRAAARTAQKDRDEIRQRMQAQITSLNDNFEQAQLRIRSLQSHVNYLKSSYTNIFAPEQVSPMGPKPIDGLSSC